MTNTIDINLVTRTTTLAPGIYTGTWSGYELELTEREERIDATASLMGALGLAPKRPFEPVSLATVEGCRGCEPVEVTVRIGGDIAVRRR